MWEPIKSSEDYRVIVYYRRRLDDRTWLAVARNSDDTWYWAHCGPHPATPRHATGIGFTTSRKAKTNADRYVDNLTRKPIKRGN
jgi:hypothetical protein